MDERRRDLIEVLFGPQPLPKSPLERRLVAYIDILGWGDTTSAIASDEQVRSVFSALTFPSVVAVTEENRKRTFDRLGDASGRTIRHVHFSDSIVYSCAAEPQEVPWLIFTVGMLCTGLLASGYYTRGAITVGDLFHDETKILGEALVRAVALEKAVACFPRIVVSDEAVPLVRSPAAPNGKELGPSQVRRDHDSLSYLDLYTTWTVGRRSHSNHHHAVETRARVLQDMERVNDLTRLPATKRADALRRRSFYGWMLSYLDSVIAEPYDPPTVPPSDDE